MGIYAGKKGCKVYRNGVLTHVPAGEPVPEFYNMSPLGLELRIRQGVVTVDWDEDDILLNESERPIPSPEILSTTRSSEPERRVIETSRGFTEHIMAKSGKRFLCGRKIQAAVSAQADDVATCKRCQKRLEDG